MDIFWRSYQNWTVLGGYFCTFYGLFLTLRLRMIIFIYFFIYGEGGGGWLLCRGLICFLVSRNGWAALPRGSMGLSAVCDCGIS